MYLELKKFTCELAVGSNKYWIQFINEIIYSTKSKFLQHAIARSHPKTSEITPYKKIHFARYLQQQRENIFLVVIHSYLEESLKKTSESAAGTFQSKLNWFTSEELRFAAQYGWCYLSNSIKARVDNISVRNERNNKNRMQTNDHTRLIDVDGFDGWPYILSSAKIERGKSWKLVVVGGGENKIFVN